MTPAVGNNAIRNGRSAISRNDKHETNGHAPQISEEIFEGRYGLIGTSPAMHKVYSQIERISPHGINVHIIGESGTGKSLVAKAIHENSPRSERELFDVNASAISKELLESEFFGHEKGAFTGAIGQKEGYFKRAEGSTLYLDEIVSMPIAQQVKILKALEEGRFHRVGGTEYVESDFRLITSSQKPLEEAVEKKEFREDLMYRLGVEITIPPLRERPEDIPLLARYLLKEYNSKENIHQIQGIESQALDFLSGLSWPGNVRELRKIIYSACVFTDNNELTTKDIHTNIRSKIGKESSLQGEAWKYMTLDEAKQETYRNIIILNLKRERGNVGAAARNLKTTYDTMGKYMDKFKIDAKDYKK